MVGRLVEQHDFRLAEERLRQQHLDLFAALQGVHLGVMQLGRNSEALKDLRRLGLRLPAIELRELPFEKGGVLAVRFGEVLLGVEGLLFLHDLIEARVSHKNGIHHRILVILEMVLLEDRHPHLGRNHDLAARTLKIARKQPQEG